MKKLLLILSLVFVAGCSSNSTNEVTIDPIQDPNLAVIDTIEIQVLESFPVQYKAVVSGNFANGCQSLGEPSQEIEKNKININLPIKTAGEMCTQALVPFTESISIDSSKLKSGSYELNINGRTASLEVN